MNGDTSQSKIVLITGCSSGFGRLTALTLARQGHQVFATMRDSSGHNKAKKEELAKIAGDEKLALKVIELDVCDDRSVAEAVEEVAKAAGRIDVLVNNAGVMYVGITEAYTLEQARQQMEVNYFGVLRLNRAVLPHMRRHHNGLIIHVTSLAGRLVFPYFGLYCASKFAVEAVAETFRYELAGQGIDSVIVEPGPFPSGLIDKVPLEEDQARLKEYGERAAAPRQMLSSFDEFLHSDTAPNPQDVADAVAGLIAAPAAERPLRTVAGGIDYGVVALNGMARPVQQGLLEGLDMQAITSLA